MSVDARIAGLAHRQHGNVQHAQLREIGLSKDAIWRRRRRGTLIDRHRGVYAYGYVREDFLSRASAARLAAAATITGMAAARVYGAADDYDGSIQLVRPTRAEDRDGLNIIESDPGKPWWRHFLPLTSPSRTLLEIAATEPEATVVRIYNELQVKHLLTPSQLSVFLADKSGRKGLGLLRELSSEQGISRSTLEDLLRPLLKAARLPVPSFNAAVLGFEVDAVWEHVKVVIELDSRRFHDTDVRFESDRARDTRLAAAGYLVLRFTYRRLKREPHAVVAEIAAVLAVRKVSTAP